MNLMGLRISLFLVMIAGAIYAATGLFTSLRDFGIGTAVVALAVCCQGLIQYVADHDSQLMSRYRDEVWDRRDSEWL